MKRVMEDTVKRNQIRNLLIKLDNKLNKIGNDLTVQIENQTIDLCNDIPKHFDNSSCKILGITSVETCKAIVFETELNTNINVNSAKVNDGVSFEHSENSLQFFNKNVSTIGITYSSCISIKYLYQFSKEQCFDYGQRKSDLGRSVVNRFVDGTKNHDIQNKGWIHLYQFDLDADGYNEFLVMSFDELHD